MVYACTLFSSSGGNCAYIRSGRDELLIDAGVSARRINESLHELGTDLANIRAILVTHEHTDHIKGIGTISRRYGIPVYAPFLCVNYIRKQFPESAPYLRENDAGSVLEFGDTRVTAFATPHDSCSSVCFRIETPCAVIGYATDIGYVSDQVYAALCGADGVVVEANHDLGMLSDGCYPAVLKKRIASQYGHLSNIDCASLICRLVRSGTKHIVLAHLSEENNRPPLALAAARGTLAGQGITVGGELTVRVAPPDGVCEILTAE